MNITVLGCGRWVLSRLVTPTASALVTLWGRPSSRNLETLRCTGKNEYLTLPSSIALTDDLADALHKADVCIISISAQQLRSFAGQLRETEFSPSLPFVLAMKGLEIGSGKRLTTVMEEELGPDVQTAVWVGPGHVQDFVAGMPNCMVMASRDMELTRRLVDVFTSPSSASTTDKTFWALKSGQLPKTSWASPPACSTAQALRASKGHSWPEAPHELSVLIEKLGGNAMTVYGLSHLGDYEATLFSAQATTAASAKTSSRASPS